MPSSRRPDGGMHILTNILTLTSWASSLSRPCLCTLNIVAVNSSFCEDYQTHLLPLEHLPENDVLAVEMRGDGRCNEELPHSRARERNGKRRGRDAETTDRGIEGKTDRGKDGQREESRRTAYRRSQQWHGQNIHGYRVISCVPKCV